MRDVSHKERREATERYMASHREYVIVGPFCRCRSFDFPHDIERHKELRAEWDWRTQSERKPLEYWWN